MFEQQRVVRIIFNVQNRGHLCRHFYLNLTPDCRRAMPIPAVKCTLFLDKCDVVRALMASSWNT
jgi:hypothetical protein